MSKVATPPSASTAVFKIHSNGAVKAYTRKNDAIGGEDYFIEGIASSNVRDRHGDTITAQGQAQMLEAAKGLTMFLNHEYNVPEDVLGTCEESTLEASGDVIDLAIRCKLAQSSKRAMDCWKLIQADKVKLGVSIGGQLTEFEVDEENDDGSSWCPPLIIDGINLLEISLCGVPANPRSYTRDFVSEISRGFMRSAARSPQVRGMLRKTLLGNDEPFDDLRDADAVNDALATAEAAGANPDVTKMRSAEREKVGMALGHVQAAMTHGACTDAMTHMQSAQDCLQSILPETDDPAVDDVDAKAADDMMTLLELDDATKAALREAK
ncbi:MAG: HK97 family phage prohead protease, partial [Rhodanobacteraceae bacterium]